MSQLPERIQVVREGEAHTRYLHGWSVVRTSQGNAMSGTATVTVRRGIARYQCQAGIQEERQSRDNAVTDEPSPFPQRLNAHGRDLAALLAGSNNISKYVRRRIPIEVRARDEQVADGTSTQMRAIKAWHSERKVHGTEEAE